MRKLKLQMQLSVDSFVSGPNYEMDWMTWEMDDELKEYIMDIHKPVDTIILGANLANGFIDIWNSRHQDPVTKNEFTHKMTDSLKVVFSKSLENNNWKNTEYARGEITEEVNKLKNMEGGDIIVYGGASFASSLIKAGLIDKYHLFVNPTAIGIGKPIFNNLDSPLKLNLQYAQSYKCGIVVQCYVPKRD